MESLPRDPYERQLLEVFKSCDFDGKGVLDDAGLEKLCELLHLDEAREELRSFLVPNGSGTSAPVTFSKFRDALLTLLGGLRGDRTPSPVREVSPKYVYGEKKYGRRSRPESIEKLEQLDNSSESNQIKITNTLHSTSLNNIRLCSSSDNDHYSISDSEEVEPVNKLSINKEYEVSGESELRNAWERLGVGREGYLHRNELAMVCSAVGMDTMADQVVSQVFSTLKPDDEGRILFEDFLELFRSKNCSTPQIVEHQIQFSKSSSLTDINDLSNSATSRLFQELNNARIQLEAVTAERDKLKADLADANERSTMLAQEVDEHHARIEKASRDQIELIEQKHQEDIKALKYQMSAEKDQLLSSNQRLEKSLMEHLDQLNKLNSELASLKLECENLEKENRTLNNELANSDSLKKDFQEQQECMSSLHQRVYELESLHEQSSGIIQRINCLQSENTELRDKNDELTIQLEQLLTQNSHRKDSFSDCASGTKRRVKSPELFTVTRLEKVRRCEIEDDVSLKDISSQDFSISSMDEKDLELDDETYSISTELWTSKNGFFEKKEVGVQTEKLGHLEKHCYELETELERVRDKIIKILSERRACSEENCALKKTLQTLMKKNVEDPFLSSPKNSECLQSALNMECLKCKDDALNVENERLLNRCRDLEKSLELLKDEYEKTEDYWEKKLEEERNIFEKDQEQSDEKFAELEAKIQEYAELFAVEQSKKPSLPPIEENEYFEKQFTQLEEEFENFRKEMNQKLGLKDEQIEQLEIALQSCQNRHSVREEGVQTNFSETPKFGAKYRPSSIPRDYCNCARGKAREKLRSDIENLYYRKRVLLNQIASLQTNAQLTMPRMDNVHVFHTLSSRLRQQEIRCGELQNALRHQQKQTEQILQKAWERHKYDLHCIQNSLKTTQEQLQQQRKSTKQQIDKLNASDALVKELCSENKNLVQMLTGLEQKYQSMSHPILPNSI